MELTWWGTASYRVKTKDEVFLIDPYFTRNKRARPVQNLGPEVGAGAGRIFITHGHFDHLADVPAVLKHTEAEVYCCPTAAETLIREGADQSCLHEVKEDGRLYEFDSYTAEANYSRHVVFDRALLVKTLLRCHVLTFKYLPLVRNYPVGQVLSWRFMMEGLALHHFGSGGSTPEELGRLSQRKTDVLLVPLQGHTHIDRIASEYVKVLKPRLVIPHHQDDFFPPISQHVDITSFVNEVRKNCPGTQVKVLEMNETITL